jgi:hypothetical protein
MNTEELYRTLKERCTVAHMKELTVSIIDAYKAKDYRTLARMMQRVVPGSSPEEMKGSAIFFALVKHFHPDRHAAIMKEIEDAYVKGDGTKLELFRNAFFSVPATKEKPRTDIEFEPEDEEYAYDADDYYDYFDGDAVSESDDEFDFWSAIKSALHGNLDFEIGPEDLEYLAGELDLSDRGLVDIDGIEHCLRITTLDLSKNSIARIENLAELGELRELSLAENEIADIDCLAPLSSLEILDLSGNEIEDASVLLDLDNLRVLDIRDNPLADRGVLAALRERSVVVVE